MMDLMTRPVLIGLLGIAGLSGCDNGLFGDCADAVKARARSPDGQYVATVFERDCGATTDFSTHVELRNTDELLTSSKHVSILTIAGRVTVDVKWRTDRTLLVLFPKANIFAKLDSWQDVDIIYN